ncbi:unnamed protein product [Effrenium voratum]|uniref:Tyrosinase copper-binding domain-containing protein n=1 Tax=Effrenium voratum TaxID=2562239 RepID=A0AA36JF65_9DINO|nr:unnamed protein product [Effrenium voratum]
MERVPTSEPEFDGKSVKGNHCRGWKACTFLATGVALILVGGVWARNHHGDHHKVDELLELFGRKRIRQAALGGGARGWSASGDADSDSAKKAEKSWDLLGGKGPKFKNKPRVRREWRTLSDEMREKVANAFWTLKTLTTEAGQAKYGPDFHNHDDMLFLHSCATTDPKCDQGHFGPQFMTFHRALLLKYERAMLSVDPSIEALPYWNIAFDSLNGKYRNDPEKYIFTNKYFGSYYGTGVNYQVIDGLFANWPIAKYTEERFGKDSPMAAISTCVRKEYFKGYKATTCDKCCGVAGCTCEESDERTTYLRNHDDCSPHVARWPEDPDAMGPLGGTYELLYSEEDFDKCKDIRLVRSWMEWQDCIEMGNFMCSQRFNFVMGQPEFPKTFRQKILPEMKRRAAAAVENEQGRFYREAVRQLEDAADSSSSDDSFTNVIKTLVKGLCGDYMLYGYLKQGRTFLGQGIDVEQPRFFHSQAHIKFGKDLLDVTTSPNEAAAFTGYHSDIDRNNMMWMVNSESAVSFMDDISWAYPRTQKVRPQDVAKTNTKGLGKGISGPFAIYDVLACGNNSDMFYEYEVGESPWLPGTLLNDVVNDGFPFKNLFTCKSDEKCDGGSKGYTHREMLYWTSPERTPYTYDTLEHLYYDI